MLAIAILAGLLGIALGYAARQREHLKELRDDEKKQAELDKMRRTVAQRDQRVESLILDNIALREANVAHETNLKMLLKEMGGK